MLQQVIKTLNELFPDVPVYSFYIPENAPDFAICVTPAGAALSQRMYDNTKIRSNTFKLTISSNSITDIITNTCTINSLEDLYQIGSIPILSSSITGQHDSFEPETGIFERTYSFNFKFKEV